MAVFGEEPDDETLRALGAVAWAAINLEDTVQTLARIVLRRDQGRTPISTFIKSASDEIERHPEKPGFPEAAVWLACAQDALHSRNAVMHAVPVQFFDGDTFGPTHLQHFPNRGSDIVTTPLTVEALSAIEKQIDDACSGWVSVALSIQYP